MKKKKVVVSGYYGFGNLGDEAILSAITRGLNNEISNLSISVISNSSTTYLSDYFDIKSIKRTSFINIIREILSSDLFISGGGGLLQDSSGVSTIVYYLGLATLAKIFGKKVFFYAQGFGPVSTSHGASLVKRFANNIDLISVRDNESRKLFYDFGVKNPPILVTADPVIALKGSGSENVYHTEGLPPKTRYDVAISVRPWHSTGDYLAQIAQAADSISEKFGARIIIIPFQLSQDLEVCNKLKGMMKSPAHVLKGSYTPEEMISFMGEMDYLIAMRLHALIFAASSRTPMAGVVYDPKVRIFSEQIKVPCWSLDSLNSDEIIDEVSKAFADIKGIKTQISRNIEPYYEKSLETAKIAAKLLEGEKPEKIAEKYI